LQQVFNDDNAFTPITLAVVITMTMTCVMASEHLIMREKHDLHFKYPT